MAIDAFNLVGRIQLARDVNVKPVINHIQNQLSKARFTVNVIPNARGLSRLEGLLNRVAGAADNLSTSIAQSVTQSRNLVKSFDNNKSSTGLKQIQSELKVTQNRISSVETTATKLGGSLHGAFLRSAVGATIAYGAVRQLIQGFAELVEFDRKIHKLSQVIGVSVGSVQDLRDAVRDTSIKFGVSSNELLDVATNLKRAGVETSKVKDSLALFAKLKLSEGISDIEATAKAYVVLDRVFGQSSQQIERSFNQITNLSARFAIESEDVVKALQISGPLFKQQGATLEDFTAIFASTAEATQLSASQISNAMKTIFTRISSAPETISALEKAGISLQDAAGRFVGPTRSVEILVDALSKLDDADTSKLELLQKISGTRQISVLVGLLNSYNRQLEARAILQGQTNKLDRDSAIIQGSLATSAERIRQTFLKFLDHLSQDRSLRNFLDTTLRLTNSLIKLADVATPLAVPLLAGLAGRYAVGKLGSRNATPAIPVTAKPAPPYIPSANALKQADAIAAMGRVSAATRLYARDLLLEEHRKRQLAKTTNVLSRTFPDATAKMTTFVNSVASGVNRLVRSAGFYQGILGAGLIGVSQFGKEGAVKDTAVAGLGTGLALSLAGVPVPAAISVGLLAGLTHYSDAVERQAKRIQDADIAQALSDITAQIKLSGDRLSPASLGAGRGLFGRLSEAQGRVNKELGTGQVIGKTVSRLFGEVITLEAFDRIFSGEVNRQTISTADQTRNLVRKERQDAFNEALNASTDDILAFRQAILESGVRSLQDFKGYADGFGAQLLEVGKLADANFEQSTAKLIEAANIAKGRQIRLSAVAAQGSRLALGVAGRIPNATGLGTAGFGNAVRGLGLDAQTSGTLRGVNAAAFALPRILASGRFSENFAAEIGTALRQAGIGDSVVNAVTAQLETVSFDDFNESLGNLQQTSDKLLSSFDPLVQQTERLIEVQKELVEKRNQELSQFVTNRAGLVDARERATLAALGSRENALRLRGRPLSTDAGNAIAVGSAISLAGTADVSQLGANLKTLTDAFKATEDSRYLESITLVTKALEKLSDTTLRTRNIEEELNKARSSKEAKLRFAEGFFSSDLRGRLELAKSLAAARKAVAVGDLSKLTPRESAAAIAGLRAVEGIKLGATGKTGRELLDDLLVKSTKGLVTREDTTIEELTRKSILITTDAAKASRELAISQERIFANFVALLSAENKTFLDGLARLFARGRASGGIVSGPGSSTSDSIPARLSNGEYVMSAAAVNRIGVGNLDAMNFARGGRVYRDRFQRSALRALARSTRVGAITDARMAVASGTIYSPFTGRSYGGSPMGSRYKFIDDPGFAPVRPLAASRAFRRGYATGGYVSGGSAGLPSGLVAQFSSGVLTLANAVNNLSQIRIPEQITMSATMKHEVVLNGASVLTQLQPALLAIVDQAIGETLRKHISLQQRLEQPV